LPLSVRVTIALVGDLAYKTYLPIVLK
jgi:hypothetical protein